MSESAGYSVITRENWIGSLTPEIRADVKAHMVDLHVPAGSKIAVAGEPCNRMFQVASGYVRLTGLHVDGSEALITIYVPGNCYAETALVAHRPYNHNSVALVDCTLRVLNGDDFWRLYHRHGAIPEALCRKFAGAITRQIMSREARATMKLGQRMAMMFHNFATYASAGESERGIAIGFPITQQDIATLFDVTRQSVHREIAELRSLGLVDKIDGCWTVRNMAGLVRRFETSGILF